MSVYLKWAGAGVILLSALYVGREYSAYVRRRLQQHRAFVALLLHIEQMISQFLTPQDGLWRDFSNDELEKCGFLPLLREGKGLSQAFEKVKASLSLSERTKEMLSGFFADFGGGYLDGEMSRTAGFRAELESCLEKEGEELEKSLKITNALLVAGAVGIVILII